MREEFFHDPAAPSARLVTPSVFAAVRGPLGRLLLVRRVDSGNWELPGGQVEVGDTATGALLREVTEESGVSIDVLGVAGVYTEPHYVIRSAAGLVRQPFVVVYHAAAADGTALPRPDRAETSEAAWFEPADVHRLPSHPAMRHWIDDALRPPGRTAS